MIYTDRQSSGSQRYFIDIRDGQGTVKDQEGTVFASLEAALEEAKESARDIVRQYMTDRIPLTATCVEIRDAGGTRVAALTVAELLAHPAHPHFKAECAEVPQAGHR
ncbi:MAG TPA: hypothetical protein VHM27_12440 [Rhizomicrobium sp.]|nr:hypothetical protein [Rhizomicrobium sp.]